MGHKRAHSFQNKDSRTPQPTTQFASRPFAASAQIKPKGQMTQDELENEAFNQNKVEAFGLQLKEKSGTITPVEQEQLGLLQAKMDDFWAQKLEKTSQFGFDLSKISVTPPGQPATPHLQPMWEQGTDEAQEESKRPMNPSRQSAAEDLSTSEEDRIQNAISWVTRSTTLKANEFTIEDANLTRGNCHGLTFLGKKDETFTVDYSNLFNNWEKEGKPEIAVFLLNNELAHTARKTESGYLHKLTNGPTIYCDPRVYATAYGYTDVYLLPKDVRAVREITEASIQEAISSETAEIVDKILGEGFDKDLPNAVSMYENFQKMSDEEKQGFIESHQEEIKKLKQILINEHRYPASYFDES